MPPSAARTGARRGPGERHQEVPMRFRRRPGVAPLGPSRAITAALAAVAATTLIVACSSGSSSSPASGGTSTGSASTTAETPIGVDLTYNNTAFWAAYINYETQYAKQLHIKMIGPLLAGNNANVQNTQIETLVNEGAKAIVVNPETATSLGPAISYAAKHGVQLISVDTIVGVGHVYMVVRASNLQYGLDACAAMSSKFKSGYVLDLEGDLTSSNGADRTNAFNDCMAKNAPNVHILKDPTNWITATAVTDAQNAANGVKLAAGQPGGGAPTLAMVSFGGTSNLGDPIVPPFVTKSAQTLQVTPVDGLSGAVATTPVTNASLWGNVYGNAHGGVCSAS